MQAVRIFISGFVAGFKDFGQGITKVVNFVLLFFVYFIGVGITWLFAKMAGKHFLAVKKEQEKKSYWIEEKVGKRKEEEYYRSF